LIDAGNDYRFRIAKCGRRGGKTAIGSIDTLINGAFKYGSPDSCGIIGEPTYSMIEDIVMPYIEEHWPPVCIHKISKKDHYIQLKLPPSSSFDFYRGRKMKNGQLQPHPHKGGIHTIHFCSYTHPSHFRGKPNIAYFWLDEIAMADEMVWKILNYGIGDRLAPGLFTTTPKFEVGTLWLKEFCEKAIKQQQFAGYSQDEWIALPNKQKAAVLEQWAAYEMGLTVEDVTGAGTDGAAQPPLRIPWAFRYYMTTWTSMDNPYLPPEEKVRIQHEVEDEDFYRQEILGEFVEGGKFIFGDLDFEMYDESDHRNYNLECFLTIDPAYTDRDIEERSQTAMNVIGVSPDRDLFILENIAGYWSTAKQLDMLFLLQQKYNCRVVGVERNSAYMYLEKLVGEKQRETGHVFELRPINTYNEQKVARAQVVPPFIKNGMLKFPKTADGKALIDQMKSFPLGRWTDRVDAIAGFFSRDMDIVEGMQKEFYVPVEFDPDFIPLLNKEQLGKIEHEGDETLSLRLN